MIEFKKGQKILFDGDSMTAQRRPGYADQWPWLRISNNHRSYADVFSELLFAWRPDLALDFRLAAIGGDSMVEVLARFDSAIADYKPEWVFMTIGGNDQRSSTPEEFAERIEDYAQRIQAWSGQLVLINSFKPCPGSRDESGEIYEKVKPFRQVQYDLAAKHENIHSIDVSENFHKKGTELNEQSGCHSMYSDGGHLSNLGAMVLAGEVLKACGIVCK
ncbi:MAG: hypothetical protein HRU15_16375 [Planctomycetes bacterium]|nr:hypothetical protein [Planctomycetota bacterium]